MYTPDLKAFKERAEHGNLIPVYREIVADLETPVSAFLKLKEKSNGHAFLLEPVLSPTQTEEPLPFLVGCGIIPSAQFTIALQLLQPIPQEFLNIRNVPCRLEIYGIMLLKAQVPDMDVSFINPRYYCPSFKIIDFGVRADEVLQFVE